MKPITSSSTKVEILAAYQELQNQLKQEETAVTPIPQVNFTSSTPSLQEAIKSLLSFKSATDDLITTLEIQKQQQVAKEQTAKDELHQFQVDLKRMRQELEYELKRTRQTKLDELEVELTTRRRQHTETITQEKQALEQQQHELSAQQTELKQLRHQVEQFPQELDKAVKQAVDAVRTEEQTTAKVTRDLLEKQVEGDTAIAQLKISNLEQTVKTQSQEIIQLKQQLNQSTQQVKDIAVSVIDSHRPFEEPKSA